MKKLLIAALFLPLSGCQTISGWADSAGEYLPTIGDRCEHWQCVTDSGQAQSDAIKAQQAKQSKSGPAADSAPDTSPAAPSAPPN
jgi:hypothetical protein